MAGASAGFLVLPLLFTHLQNTYGYKGTVLIFGGCLFNTVVAAALLHPLEWHSRKIPVIIDDICILGEKYKVLPAQIDEKGLEKLNLGEEDKCIEVEDPSIGLYNEKRDYMSGPLTESHSKDINIDDNDVAVRLNCCRSCCQRMCTNVKVLLSVFYKVFQTTYHNFGALRSLRVVIISFGAGALVSGYLNFILMIPFVLKDKNISTQMSAYCLSLWAICNAFGRLFVPLFSDLPKFSNVYAFMTGNFFIALSIVALAHIQNLKWIMVGMGFMGFSVGGSMGLYTIVMIDVMGLEKLPSTLGVTSFVIGVIFIILGPLIGFIRDVSGSYALSNSLLGCIVFTSFLLWLFMPLAKKYDLRKEYVAKRNEALKRLVSRNVC